MEVPSFKIVFRSPSDATDMRFSESVITPGMKHSTTEDVSRTPAYISYVLHIRKRQTETLRIGKRGTFSFDRGSYLYIGSARRGLDARIRRHLSEEKNCHWHIDYLLNAASVASVYVSEQPECELAHRVRDRSNGSIPVPGFGASDCSCPAHLLHLSSEPDLSLDVYRTGPE